MDLAEKTLTSKVLYDGVIIRAELDSALLPDGTTANREVVRHPGGVCVAALNDKNELAFVRQYRYPYAEIVSELPAGKLERGEDPFEAVKRELKEETGAQSDSWKDMGWLYPSPGYCDEIIHLYACRISSVGEQTPDEDEFLEAEYVPLEKALEMVMRGELRDAKTQTLILKLHHALSCDKNFI